ncbi:MAG: PHP domain-containing protein [Chloroflexi bacterium]|nr:PHP domain-containing protein [Chloroflexota bacterium]
MDNNAISRVFSEVAVLMQAKGENVFKVRAHTRAAGTIKNLPFPITKIVGDTDRMREIPGFGEGIVETTRELINTGRLDLLEQLRQEVPDGVAMLAEIPGIGPRTAWNAATDLGISTFEQLAASIASGEFLTLPRIGKKASQQILRHTEMRIAQGSRIGLGRATDAAAQVVAELKDRCPDIEQIEVAGSIRRGAELIGDINLVCGTNSHTSLIDAFTNLGIADEVMSRDRSGARIRDTDGLEYSVYVVSPDAFVGALVYATGSIAHGTRLERIAADRGFKLTRDGLFVSDSDQPVAAATEQDLYERLGLNFIPPEMREDSGEIEHAVESDFSDIVTANDIRGDLHSHTDWSDGRFPMAEMIESAQKQSYEYLAIADHSQSATIANGLSPERLIEHNNAVRHLNSTATLRLLTGTEMDIKPNGSLDYSDELLADLDIVIASIHSGMDQDERTMTRRVISAMESPHVDVI